MERLEKISKGDVLLKALLVILALSLIFGINDLGRRSLPEWALIAIDAIVGIAIIYFYRRFLK